MSEQMNVNLAIIPNEVCKCGSVFWKQVMLTKRVKGLLIGSSQDQIANVPILMCHSCEEVLPDHLIFTKEIIKPTLKIS